MALGIKAAVRGGEPKVALCEKDDHPSYLFNHREATLFANRARELCK